MKKLRMLPNVFSNISQVFDIQKSFHFTPFSLKWQVFKSEKNRKFILIQPKTRTFAGYLEVRAESRTFERKVPQAGISIRTA